MSDSRMGLHHGFAAYLLIGIALLSALASPARGQQPGNASNHPEAEAWAEGIASAYATAANVPGLATAIQNGTVNVYPGSLGSSLNAISTPGTATTPAVIIVNWTADGRYVGPGAVHEWYHIANNHIRLAPGHTPTPLELRVQACQECNAHCATLNAMVVVFGENGTKPPCSIRNSINNAASGDCFLCYYGPNGQGPPSPTPCGSASSVPCTP